MASRFRSLSKPTFNLLKPSFSHKPTSNSIPSLHISLPSSKFPRALSQMGAIQSLLPLHSAVSSARLTSCLGIDSRNSRSLSQELWLYAPMFYFLRSIILAKDGDVFPHNMSLLVATILERRKYIRLFSLILELLIRLQRNQLPPCPFVCHI